MIKELYSEIRDKKLKKDYLKEAEKKFGRNAHSIETNWISQGIYPKFGDIENELKKHMEEFLKKN